MTDRKQLHFGNAWGTYCGHTYKNVTSGPNVFAASRNRCPDCWYAMNGCLLITAKKAARLPRVGYWETHEVPIGTRAP